MYSSNKIKGQTLFTQPAILNIFVEFSCDISVMYVVLTVQNDNYNKDDWGERCQHHVLYVIMGCLGDAEMIYGTYLIN